MLEALPPSSTSLYERTTSTPRTGAKVNVRTRMRDGWGCFFCSATRHIPVASNAGTQYQYVSIASGVTNVFVRHCSFTQIGDTTQSGLSGGTDAIYNSGTLSSSTIEYCFFDNLGGLPFFLRGGSGNVIQYNYSGDICGMSVFNPDNHCEGLVLHDMSDVHFRWNYIAECPSSGGFVKNDTQVSSDIRIYGNTFANGFPINCNSGPCTSWRIFNNTFRSTTGGPFGGDGATVGLLFFDNIVFEGSLGPLRDEHGYDWFSKITGVPCQSGGAGTENLTVAYPNDCDSSKETLDPFVDSAGAAPEDYRLTGPLTSWPGTDVCALDPCTSQNRYDVDAFGHVRGGDGVWDRGAYEYGVGNGGTGGSAAMGGAAGAATGGAAGAAATGGAAGEKAGAAGAEGGASGGGGAPATGGAAGESSGGGAPGSDNASPHEAGGCGCRAVGPAPARGLALFLAVGVALRRRRARGNRNGIRMR